MTETFENNRQVEVIEHHGEIKPRQNLRMSTREIIKQICLNNPVACKCDDVLYFEYLKKTKQISMKENKYEIFISIPKNKYGKLSKPGNILRTRRDLHGNKEIFYDDETERARAKYSKEFKERYSHQVPEEKPINMIS